MKEGWSIWKKIIVGLFSLFFCFILGVALIVYFSSCFSASCIADFGNECRFATATEKEDFGKVKYEIHRNYDTRECFFTKTILSINKRVRIISGLFGLVKPDQNIPDYKLKIDKLDAQKWWKPILELKDEFVIDLLPQAHRKAFHYEKGITIEFVLEKNGKKQPAGHNGKLIKGV